MWTTGKNEYGQLGLGDTTARKVPTQVSLLAAKKVTTIACGRAHTLCLTGNILCNNIVGDPFFKESGEVYGFGRSDLYHLGVKEEKILTPQKCNFIDSRDTQVSK